MPVLRLSPMKTKTGSISLRSLGGLVTRAAVRKLYFLTLVRVLTNLLDIAGVAGVAFLATSLAGGSDSIRALGQSLDIETELSPRILLLFTLGTAGIFVMKSVLSVWLKLKTSVFTASLEVEFSRRLANDFFFGASERQLGLKDSLSDFQNVSIESTKALTMYVNARISAISEIALLASLTAVFLAVNPLATLAMLLYLLAILFVLNRVVSVKIRRNAIKTIEGSQWALTLSRELFNVRREVRAAGLLEYWVDRFSLSRSKSASGNALIYTLNSLHRYVIESSLVLAVFAFIAGAVALGDLPSQAATIGVFMAGGIRIVASLLPLQTAVNYMTDGASRGRLALDRLKAASERNLKLKTTKYDQSRPGSIGVEFQSVSFEFESGVPVLKDVSLSIAAGQKVALVGPSGAGKSTCFDLATGFRTAQSGEVFLGGRQAHVLLQTGGGIIGIVPQRPHLVSGTLAENVSLASAKDTDNLNVSHCLEMAGLANLASHESLEMEIRPDSGQLSGGEIQRVGLARALYRKPGILFLDEATSALDAQTEAEVNEILDRLRGQMTIVLIAHRLSTVKTADKIIYLDKGRVVAEGTFKELQKKVPDFEKAVKLMGLE